MYWGLVGLALWLPEAVAGKGGNKPPPPPPPSSSEPPARMWHAFTGNGMSAASSSRLYVFGGQGGDGDSPVMLGDFWYYRADTASWTMAPTGRSKPGVRDGVGLSCGGGKCLLSNGRRLGALKETWIYTEATASWSQVNCTRNLCPPARAFPAAAYDPVRDQHVIFGGEPAGWNGQYLDDTYVFAGGKWTDKSSATRPPPRAVAAATFVGGAVGRIALFGGAYYKLQPGGYYQWEARCDLWTWDGAAWSPVSMSGAGPCLAFATMAWDDSTQELVVASGETLQDGREVANRDVWRFRFESASSGSWTRDAGTPFFSCASNASPMALIALAGPGQKKVFFGGWQNTAQGVEWYANTTVCD